MSILDDIVARKRVEIEQARSRISDKELFQRVTDLPPAKDFVAALRQPGMRIIAEVKKASPSAGVIRADFDPVKIATIYEANGADCLSVLTDEHFFQGHLDYLRSIRDAVTVPLLRKEFILDRYQLLEARDAGADAVLLIAEILPGPRLKDLFDDARALGLQVLIEIHDAEQLPRVLDLDPPLVGINNRDLRSFTTRLEHTLDLMPRIPNHIAVVSESGIRTNADLQTLEAAGVKAVLVGESLMKAADIGQAFQQLRVSSHAPLSPP